MYSKELSNPNPPNMVGDSKIFQLGVSQIFFKILQNDNIGKRDGCSFFQLSSFFHLNAVLLLYLFIYLFELCC